MELIATTGKPQHLSVCSRAKVDHRPVRVTVVEDLGVPCQQVGSMTYRSGDGKGIRVCQGVLGLDRRRFEYSGLARKVKVELMSQAADDCSCSIDPSCPVDHVENLTEIDPAHDRSPL